MTTFRVNRAQDVMAGALATVRGVEQNVAVPTFEVELVDDTGQHGTLTMRYQGADIVAAREKYVPDETVNIDI